MAKEILDFKEAVTLFLSRTMIDLKDESEVPAINVVFPESAFKLFTYIQQHPFEKEGYYVPPLYDSDIEKAKLENNSNPTLPTVVINNPVKFFELLTELTNSWINQKNKYWGSQAPRALFIQSIKRIFLRMAPNDLLNVESFLEKEVSFLKDTTFSEYIKNNAEIGTYEGYKLYTSLEEAQSWCETSSKMTFFLKKDDKEYHTLPSIYFGITVEDGEQVCYIYAIQNESQRVKSKKAHRLLYKLNKGIENPDVNPASVLVLQTFISLLKQKGITNIKVPRLQVLSYRYHELLSEKTRKEFTEKYTPEYLEYISNLSTYEKARKLEDYESEKAWYSHVVDKQDFIHKAKTEGLFKIFYRIQEQFGSLDQIDTSYNQDDTINFRITDYIKKTL